MENRQEKNLTTQDAKERERGEETERRPIKKNTLNQNDEFIITVNFTECDTIAFQTEWNSQIAYGSFLFIKNNLAPHFRWCAIQFFCPFKYSCVWTLSTHTHFIFVNLPFKVGSLNVERRKTVLHPPGKKVIEFNSMAFKVKERNVCMSSALSSVFFPHFRYLCEYDEISNQISKW